MSENAQERAADLVRRGYVEVQEFGKLSVGARIRAGNEQYREALMNGTGNIERIFHKDNPGFEERWGPDVELIVKRDKPRWGPNDTHAFLADYHVVVIPTESRS